MISDKKPTGSDDAKRLGRGFRIPGHYPERAYLSKLAGLPGSLPPRGLVQLVSGEIVINNATKWMAWANQARGVE